MLVMGKLLSLRLDSTLKLFARSMSSLRYSLASRVIASLSFSHAAARTMATMPNTCVSASIAASMSAPSSCASTYTVDWMQYTRNLPIGARRRRTFAMSFCSKYLRLSPLSIISPSLSRIMSFIVWTSVPLDFSAAIVPYYFKSATKKLADRRAFLKSCVLIILCVDLEVALRVIARRADVRRLRADDDVTAVAALPHFHLALGKDLLRFHIVQ